MCLGPDGTLYFIDSAGRLDTVAPGTLQAVPTTNSNVQAILADTDGTLYRLDTPGLLYVLRAGATSWGQTVNETFNSAAVPIGFIRLDANNASIDVMETNGVYKQYRPYASTWTMISLPQISVSPQTLSPSAGVGRQRQRHCAERHGLL